MKKPRHLLISGGFAVAFAIAAFAVSNAVHGVSGQSRAQIVTAILSSISASFIFLFVLDLGVIFRESVQRRAFTQFFGELADGSKASFVYPDFELSPAAQAALAGIPPASRFSKHSRPYAGTRFIDVPEIVASNDLQAIMIMAARLGRLFGESPRLVTDGAAIAAQERSMISFGLTSNAVTELYQNTDQVPLFRIEDPSGTPKIMIQTQAGPETYGREKDIQHGIILRFRPNPDVYPDRVWFICAGLAAAGTPAAAWALAHKWQEYYKRFKRRDFVVVFRTHDDINAYSSSVEVAHVVRADAPRG